jgi:hypothetical protein
MLPKIKAGSEKHTFSEMNTVYGFPRFVNYYRQFLPDDSKIIIPLIELTKENISFG